MTGGDGKQRIKTAEAQERAPTTGVPGTPLELAVPYRNRRARIFYTPRKGWPKGKVVRELRNLEDFLGPPLKVHDLPRDKGASSGGTAHG